MTDPPLKVPTYYLNTSYKSTTATLFRMVENFFFFNHLFLPRQKKKNPKNATGTVTPRLRQNAWNALYASIDFNLQLVDGNALLSTAHGMSNIKRGIYA